MVRSSAKSIEWSKRLDRFQISGMTLTQFCKHENNSPHSFYYWKKQLADAKGRQRRSNLGPAVKQTMILATCEFDAPFTRVPFASSAISSRLRP